MAEGGNACHKAPVCQRHADAEREAVDSQPLPQRLAAGRHHERQPGHGHLPVNDSELVAIGM